MWSALFLFVEFKIIKVQIICIVFFLSESTSTDHDFCIKKIATLRQENTQLYAELGRLQTENVILKNSIEQLNIEEQLISTDSKIRFYTGIPSKSLFLWMVTFCSAVLPECKVMSPQSIIVYFHESQT